MGKEIIWIVTTEGGRRTTFILDPNINTEEVSPGLPVTVTLTFSYDMVTGNSTSTITIVIVNPLTLDCRDTTDQLVGTISIEIASKFSLFALYMYYQLNQLIHHKN